MLDALQARNGLSGHAVEDVIWGNVTQVGEQGGCLARSAVLASGLDQSIPGLVQPLLRLGDGGGQSGGQSGEGGRRIGLYRRMGSEMMSRVAMGSDGAAIAVDPSLTFGTQFVPQGISADIIATEWVYPRDGRCPGGGKPASRCRGPGPTIALRALSCRWSIATG